MVQCTRTYPARWTGAASRASRLVMMNTATADLTALLTHRLPFRTRTIRVTYRAREPPADMLRGVHDLDGAPFPAAVASLLGHVLYRDGVPVQGVQFLPKLFRVELDAEDVVGEELLADQHRHATATNQPHPGITPYTAARAACTPLHPPFRYGK